jgi:antitoxin (DNA-binding transcriptional repressor) of toxin-antitoxin stability system
VRAGIKQVKNRLSYYLRRVRAGERVEVTDRGEVVAELRAPRSPRQNADEVALTRLEAEGLATRPKRAGAFQDFEPLVPKKKGFRLSQLVLDERE